VRPRMPLDLIGSACLTSGLVLLIFRSSRSPIAAPTGYVGGTRFCSLLPSLLLWNAARSRGCSARLFGTRLVPGTINTSSKSPHTSRPLSFFGPRAARQSLLAACDGLAFLPSSIAITAIADALARCQTHRRSRRRFFGGISLMAGALIYS